MANPAGKVGIINGFRPWDAANGAVFGNSWCTIQNYSGFPYTDLAQSYEALQQRHDDPCADEVDGSTTYDRSVWNNLCTWSFLEAMREITLNYTHSEISAYNRDAYAFGGNLQAGAYHLKDPNELPKVNFAAAAKDVTSGQNNFHIKNKLIPQEPAAQPLTLTAVQVGQFNFGQAANEMTTGNSAVSPNVVTLYPNGPQSQKPGLVAGF